MTLETEKDISCLKAFAFSIVFFSFATSRLPYLAMCSPGQLPTLPNGFPFVETRLTKEKKLVKPLQGKVSCYPVGCVTSLVTIITNGRSRRDLPLATSWRRVPLPLPQKFVSPNEKRPCDSLETTRTRNATLGDGNCACACLLIELGATGVLHSNIFFQTSLNLYFFK